MLRESFKGWNIANAFSMFEAQETVYSVTLGSPEICHKWVGGIYSFRPFFIRAY
jgi:hypothetical protein